MGAFLSKPCVEKENHSGEGDRLAFSLASMQGWRTEMEDTHIATTEMEALPKTGFFAVFDGHGGKTVSTQCAEQFVRVMLESDELKNGDQSADCLKTALRQAHFNVDERLKQTYPKLTSGEDRSGSTAVAAFVTPTHIVISNCGDSRAVLCGDGGIRFGSEDHKPSNAAESKRITEADGQVVLNRVNGSLAVSRALGDYVYKDMTSLPPEKQKVSPEPDMTVFERSETDEFLVLACDGIWDVMSNDAVYTFVCNQLKAGYTPTETCNRLLDYCLSLSSKDNMSVVLVVFPAAPDKQEGFEAPEVIPDPQQQDTDQESPSPPGQAVDLDAILSSFVSAGDDQSQDVLAALARATEGNGNEQEQSDSNSNEAAPESDTANVASGEKEHLEAMSTEEDTTTDGGESSADTTNNIDSSNTGAENSRKSGSAR